MVKFRDDTSFCEQQKNIKVGKIARNRFQGIAKWVHYHVSLGAKVGEKEGGGSFVKRSHRRHGQARTGVRGTGAVEQAGLPGRGLTVKFLRSGKLGWRSWKSCLKRWTSSRQLSAPVETILCWQGIGGTDDNVLVRVAWGRGTPGMHGAGYLPPAVN
ncbi:unnamed protein product [Discosporangium mesarthrocarpum]